MEIGAEFSKDILCDVVEGVVCDHLCKDMRALTLSCHYSRDSAHPLMGCVMGCMSGGRSPSLETVCASAVGAMAYCLLLLLLWLSAKQLPLMTTY